MSMRKFLLFVQVATVLALLFGAKTALAVCQGAAGLPFNCTNAAANPGTNDIVYGGVTSGPQTGVSVRWSWGQVFTGTTLTSPTIINGTINSLNTPLSGAYGGTGNANIGDTITLGGDFTTSGAYPLTFTLTGPTNITLPTSGSFLSNSLPNTDIFVGNSGGVATGVAMTGDCTISNAGLLTCTQINGKTVSLAGTLTTTGGTLTFSLAGNTTLTVPASGTLLTVVPNYLTGLTLSNDGTSPNTVLDTAAGTASDSTNAQMFSIGAFTKTTGGAWVAGSGNAGMGNGLTIAATTWYHVCLAYNGGTPDEWFDTSAVCANKPTGVSGSLYRRIGSFETDSSSHIVVFVQSGDDFYRGTPFLEYTGTPGATTATTLTLGGVPPGVITHVILSGTIQDGTNQNAIVYLSALSQTDTSPGTSALDAITSGTASAATFSAFAGVQVLTNTSQSIRKRVNTTTCAITVATNGYVDTRGK